MTIHTRARRLSKTWVSFKVSSPILTISIARKSEQVKDSGAPEEENRMGYNAHRENQESLNERKMPAPANQRGTREMKQDWDKETGDQKKRQENAQRMGGARKTESKLSNATNDRISTACTFTHTRYSGWVTGNAGDK